MSSILPCPYCEGFTERPPEFIEVTTNNIECGIAIECPDCGLRSMVAYDYDGEEKAIEFWNQMSADIKWLEEYRRMESEAWLHRS